MQADQAKPTSLLGPGLPSPPSLSCSNHLCPPHLAALVGLPTLTGVCGKVLAACTATKHFMTALQQLHQQNPYSAGTTVR